MERDDIIRMAREAHRELVTKDYPGHAGQLDPWTMRLLERFAALVAAEKDKQIAFLKDSHDAIRELAYKTGVEAEREACARFLERGVDLKGLAGDPQMQSFCGSLLMGCATAIRERGGK